MEADWIAVAGGVALLWFGGQVTWRALSRWPGLSRWLERWSRGPAGATAWGAALGCTAPGAQALEGLPGALVRTGRLEPRAAARVAAGVGLAPLAVFVLVGVVGSLGLANVGTLALGLAGLGFALSRAGRRGLGAAQATLGLACTLGGAALVRFGFVALSITPVELPWSWTAQLAAAFGAGLLAMLALRSEAVLAALLTGAAVAGALDPYSAFSALLAARVTACGLLAFRAARDGGDRRWWRAPALGVAAATTLVGWFASGWAVVFDSRLPEALQEPPWILGSLLALTSLVHAAALIAVVAPRTRADREVREGPRADDVEASPVLAWDAARRAVGHASSIALEHSTERLKGAVIDPATLRRRSEEIVHLTARVHDLSLAARGAEVPGGLVDALAASHASCSRQHEVLEATRSLTTELADELALGSFASRVRQAKLSVVTFLEGCDADIQGREARASAPERDAVRARLAATIDVLARIPDRERADQATTKVHHDLHHLATILDLELAAAEAARIALVTAGEAPVATPEPAPGEVDFEADAAADPTVDPSPALPAPSAPEPETTWN